MQELIDFVVMTFAEKKDAVEYVTSEDTAARTVTTTVYLDPSDMGKVIGKQGKIVKALRTLVRASAPKDGKKYIVEIKEKGKD